jgi:hypothetical protein
MTVTLSVAQWVQLTVSLAMSPKTRYHGAELQHCSELNLLLLLLLLLVLPYVYQTSRVLVYFY